MNGSLQVKNGKYQAVFYVTDENGKRKQVWKSTGIPAVKGNKRKAEQRMAEIIADDKARRESKADGSDILFVDYIDHWIEAEENNVDKVTYEGYKANIDNHIRPYFEKLNLTLRDIDINVIERYMVDKATGGRLDGKAGGLSHRSIELHRAVLNIMFRDAMREPFNLKNNPCRYAKIPKTAVKNEKHINFYTVEQCKKLLELSEGTPLYDMIYLTFMYGLRRSELMGLKWSAVDFEAGEISIGSTVVVQKTVIAKNKTKNASSCRKYPILDDVLPILMRLRKTQQENRAFFGRGYTDTGYVFVKADGSPYYPSYPYHEMMKVLNKTDLPKYRWHDLRHSCATMLLERGWSMKDISDWLGHADIETTMNIYAHVDISRKRENASMLNGLLN